MKKLMFAAAVAASSMAFAATPAAQVYDVAFSIKTTKAAAAKVNDKTNPVATDDSFGTDGKLYYRTQSTLTWKGLIWGCNCEGINGVWEKVTPCSLVYDKDTKEYIEVEGESDSVKGCVIWDTKGKAPVYMGEGVNVTLSKTLSKIDVTGNPGWGWQMLQLIEKNGAGAESVWTIAGLKDLCDEDQMTFQFAGAGFGSVQFVKSGDDVACNSYVKKLTGNFAGVMRAPTVEMVTQQSSGCSFCGSVSEITECEYVLPWAWCDFGSLCGCDIGINLVEDYTAAYGTWTIAYNGSLSKKLSNVTSILDAYNFKSLPQVAAAIEIAEKQILEWEPEECEELEKALDLAQKNRNAASQADVEAQAAVAEAQADFDAVSTDSLTNAMIKAMFVKNAAFDATYVAATNYDAKIDLQLAASNELDAAQLDYDKQLNATTNSDWAITFKNSSNDPQTYTGKGISAFEEKVTELKKFTITSAQFDYAGASVYFINNSGCESFVKEQNELTAKLKEALDKKIAAVTAANTAAADAKAAKDTAVANFESAKAAERAARDRYDDRFSLQLLADQKLRKAEDAQLITAANLAEAEEALAAAQKAVDDAGCL